jgi:hypothetical protein
MDSITTFIFYRLISHLNAFIEFIAACDLSDWIDFSIQRLLFVFLKLIRKLRQPGVVSTFAISGHGDLDTYGSDNG